MNPMQQIIQMIKNGQNPQQIAMGFLKTQKANPFASNLLDLAQKGDQAQLEQIARNICAQKGVDFDKEFSNFKSQLGVK